ncbi:MAG: FAD-dependent monooxygenase [Bacteroidota bacterium]
MKTIDIIGAGIGGLTLAIALKRQGLGVRVFERAPQLRAVGAGINLACNAMQVYEQLGLRQNIEAAGHQCERMQVTDAEMRPLSEIDIRPFANRYSVSNVAIHRGALQRVLAAELQAEELLLDKELVQMESAQDLVQLHFADGTQIDSQCIIGADGIHSVVREQWFREGEIRSTDQLCWRGIANMSLPIPFGEQLTESWGRNGRFGFVQIDAQRTYWFAVMRKFCPTQKSKRKKKPMRKSIQFFPHLLFFQPTHKKGYI